MSAHSSLFNAFPASGKSEWEKVAREELQGKNPWEKLGAVRQGIAREPYYDATRTATVAPLLSADLNSPLGPRTWFNCPRVVVADARDANKVALHHLNHGADGILFDVAENADGKVLLEGIDLQHCSLSFILRKKDGPPLLPPPGSPATFLPGAIFIPDTPLGNTWRHEGIALAEENTAAASLHRTFATLLEKKFTSPAALMVRMSQDFFGDIIKLRAARMVWQRLVDAGKFSPGTLFLHGWSSPWTSAAFSPHENMLKGTYAAMAAILGGCDAITVEPAPGEDPMLSRTARNISNVLREESHLSKVADPLAGTWFIETACAQLTEEICNHLQIKP